MPQAVVALGSNVGDRLENLRRAVKALSEQLRVTKTSPVYVTAPMYKLDQAAFYNAAILVHTELAPLAFLKLLKQTEHELGREQRERNAPREIDLDLISYGMLQYTFLERGETKLQLPHPRTHERRFVLRPLADLNPDLVLPGQGRVSDLLAQTDEQASSVHRIENADLSL